MKKSMPTRRRSAAHHEQREKGQQLRGWFEERAAAGEAKRAKRRQSKLAKKRKAAAKARPTRWVVKHTGAPRAARREEQQIRRRSQRYADKSMRVAGDPVPKARKARLRPSSNRPYVNPARDLKPGARLRKELR